jgi:GGDEF domain-containing protein
MPRFVQTNSSPPVASTARIFSARLARQPAMLHLGSLGVLLVCLVDAYAVHFNTLSSAAVGYLCDALVLVACAAALWIHSRSAEGLLRVRWLLMVAALLAASIAYAQSFPDVFAAHSPISKPHQVAIFNCADALYILAIVLFTSGVSRSIIALDTVQALLLAVLRFYLTYDHTTIDHFTSNHLLVTQMVALCFFLIAMVASLGATSPAEHRFLRLLAWFFGLRFISFFCADQISYVLLHHTYSSLWDVPIASLLAAFAVYLFYTSRQPQPLRETRIHLRQPSLVVRSLMPSFLALANLALGLLLLPFSAPLATCAIVLAAVLYIARTALLQGQAAQERALLEGRNVQLEGLATHDHLTGIGNRRSLAAAYAGLQTAPAREGIALLLMDIDDFKRANDLAGHLYGDKVLITLASILEQVAAEIDARCAPRRVPPSAGVAASHCARFGGDEFALLLVGISQQEACQCAEEIRARFGAHAFRTGEHTVSVSLGVHRIDAVADLRLEALIAGADSALYRAKTLGRDRVHLHSAQENEAPPDSAAATPRIESASRTLVSHLLHAG